MFDPIAFMQAADTAGQAMEQGNWVTARSALKHVWITVQSDPEVSSNPDFRIKLQNLSGIIRTVNAKFPEAKLPASFSELPFGERLLSSITSAGSIIGTGLPGTLKRPSRSSYQMVLPSQTNTNLLIAGGIVAAIAVTALLVKSFRK
jgi:hypothetical protein